MRLWSKARLTDPPQKIWSYNKMGNPYDPKNDWRYNVYSIGGGAAWASVYSVMTKEKDWIKNAVIRFLAGMGVGGTIAYIQNSAA